MKTPLADGYAERVLWHETAGPPPVVDEAPVPSAVDVVVVGSGYCGLAAALSLAERGRSVAVLDRGALGEGASTRNGGMVLPELKAGPESLVASYGELGRRMHAAVEEAFDQIESLTTGPGGIACEYERTGRIQLAHGRRSAAGLRSLAAELGAAARYVEGADLEAEIGSSAFPAGLLVDRSGGLHPARFHAGLLARVAACDGVTLHAGTPATAVTSDGVTTPAGRVRARDVFLAVNAYADRAVPALRRRTLPIGSFVLATEALRAEQRCAVLPTRRMAYDTRNLLSYWRLDPDGRLVFGGRKGLARTAVPQARDDLYERMVRFHPQLAGVRVERAWCGDVALTVDRLPHCGRVDGAWYASGCNGSGVALMTWLGHRMAAAICGEGLPPFAELPHRPVPLHGLRSAWLPAASAWFRLQDRRG